ncbi:unnamed protein product [Vitrella brassicaformis CCMP3155]|uniref:Uncharacterized protein n=1 Tax=Vitrella brassicaformis (strain CCMP3155) TaxID=1169540 RepID=A0A0G4FTC9_VITBC|nr:unnamed protein product [Vitrella brassicaformis CCMP3155]|eukprot:CEM18058.1 unnamed protein product [Vitrella brassicaformis CCMP3155]
MQNIDTYCFEYFSNHLDIYEAAIQDHGKLSDDDMPWDVCAERCFLANAAVFITSLGDTTAGKVARKQAGDYFKMICSKLVKLLPDQADQCTETTAQAATEPASSLRELEETVAWTQIGADIDGEEGDLSGWSVAMSSDGSRLAIGARYASNSGHVRVFDLIGSTWTQVGADIDGEAAGDESGTAVAMSSDGSRLAIGAYWNDGGGDANGHVRVFDLIGSSWTQVGADIDGEAVWDSSGHSVAMSSDGSRLAIGAVENDGGGSRSGHVRVFDLIGSIWTQVGAEAKRPVTNRGEQWLSQVMVLVWPSVPAGHVVVPKEVMFACLTSLDPPGLKSAPTSMAKRPLTIRGGRWPCPVMALVWPSVLLGMMA